jgi:Uncharacterized conserved protein
MNKASESLRQRLTSLGFVVRETPLTEFLKAGGAAKCLTLRITEPIVPPPAETSHVEAKIIQMQGHLLDSGLINRALDVVVDGGGSFQVLEFKLGVQKQSTSEAKIRVSAPDREIMTTILSRLIEMGQFYQRKTIGMPNWWK